MAAGSPGVTLTPFGTGGDAHANLQRDTERVIRRRHGVYQIERRPDHPFSVVLVGRGIIEIHQQPAAPVAGDEAVVLLDGATGRRLVGAQRLPVRLKIEPP